VKIPDGLLRYAATRSFPQIRRSAYRPQERCLQRSQGGRFDLEGVQQTLEVDYLINMPVLKAHCQTKLTCALKNLKGCIPDSEKRRFHTLGLHKPIACLGAAVRADLTIVDAIVGDLTFEEGGTPVQMNRIIAGKDPVLIDAYAAQLIGYEKDDIAYISMAEKLGWAQPM